MEDLKLVLRRALVTRFGVKGATLTDDTELFSGGLIDSLSVMDLVSFLESETGCVIAPTDINLDNFDTIGRMVSYVNSLKAKDSAQ
jgi:acyl carrier protein